MLQNIKILNSVGNEFPVLPIFPKFRLQICLRFLTRPIVSKLAFRPHCIQTCANFPKNLQDNSAMTELYELVKYEATGFTTQVILLLKMHFVTAFFLFMISNRRANCILIHFKLSKEGPLFQLDSRSIKITK